MKKKQILFIFFVIYMCVCCTQKTTHVNGYYRKDGTYVKSHTRTYSSSSTYDMSSSSSFSSDNDSLSNNIMEELLKVIPNDSVKRFINSGKTIKVIANAPIYTSMELHSQTLTNTIESKKVNIIEDINNKYYKVKYGKIIGFLSKSYIDETGKEVDVICDAPIIKSFENLSDLGRIVDCKAMIINVFENEYYYVQSGTVKGYLHISYVKH